MGLSLGRYGDEPLCRRDMVLSCGGPNGQLVAAGVGKVESFPAWKGVGWLQNLATSGHDGLKRCFQVCRIENHERTRRTDLLCLVESADFPITTLDTRVNRTVVVELPAECVPIESLRDVQVAHGELDVINGVVRMHVCFQALL